MPRAVDDADPGLSPKLTFDPAEDIAATYQKRRDVLYKGLMEAGWQVDLPKASMYIWARSLS